MYAGRQWETSLKNSINHKHFKDSLTIPQIPFLRGDESYTLFADLKNTKKKKKYFFLDLNRMNVLKHMTKKILPKGSVDNR